MAELVTKDDLNSALTGLEARLRAEIENLSLRLTVRLGGLLAAGIAVLAAILKLS